MPTPGLFVDTEGREPRNIKRDFHGIPLVIEYLRGDIKPGRDPDDGSGFMQHADYGFIVGTTTNEEGEGLDVYIGPEPESRRVFLVALMFPHETDVFMEYKALLGWSDPIQAERFCRNQYFHDMVGLLQEISIPDLIDMAELQTPMTEKLMIRLSEEEEAAHVAIEEAGAHDPELTLIDEGGTAERDTENQVGDSTGFAGDSYHQHVLMADGRTSIDTGPDNVPSQHTWQPGAKFTSTDQGHNHSLPVAREPILTVN